MIPMTFEINYDFKFFGMRIALPIIKGNGLKLKTERIENMKTATTKETTKGVKIVDKKSKKDLTGLLFKDKWEAGQYWHETHKTHGEYTKFEL